jgi:hypothetical protein
MSPDSLDPESLAADSRDTTDATPYAGPTEDIPAPRHITEGPGSRIGPTSCCRQSAKAACAPSTWPSRKGPPAAAWRSKSSREGSLNELKQLRSTTFPRTLAQGSKDGFEGNTDEQQRFGAIGHLRVADNASKSATLFTGQIGCPRCSTSLDVQIERNANALSQKQPAFVVIEASRGAKPSRNRSRLDESS